MAQNRDAPAFQEYAAAMMARIEYRTMTLAARGLLYSMRLECWVNRELPNDPAILARILGFERDVVATALPAVMPFFTLQGEHITSPELENYRAHLEAIRAAQSAGGKRGAAKVNGMRKDDPSPTNQIGEGSPQVTRRVTRKSLVQQSPNQTNQNRYSREHLSTDQAEWVSDYDKESNRT